MHTPVVSIIIPTFNRADLIHETLESIRMQTYQNWECIIVDDGSDDGSENVVNTYCKTDQRFKFLQRPAERPKGANACRNVGFENSSGLFVNWFDSDDLMTEDFIQKKVDVLIQDTSLDAVISKLMAFYEHRDNIIDKEIRTHLSDNLIEDYLTLKISWYLPDIMWRRKYLKGKELFDEQLLAGQDREFHIRMLLFEPRLVVINDYLTLCRQHINRITLKVNNIEYRPLKISHLYSHQKLINLLIKKNKLTDAVKFHYFRALMFYLPFVISSKEDTIVLLNLLKQLSGRDIRTVISWGKFALAYFSFKICGRGDFFLR